MSSAPQAQVIHTGGGGDARVLQGHFSNMASLLHEHLWLARDKTIGLSGTPWPWSKGDTVETNDNLSPQISVSHLRAPLLLVVSFLHLAEKIPKQVEIMPKPLNPGVTSTAINYFVLQVNLYFISSHSYISFFFFWCWH